MRRLGTAVLSTLLLCACGRGDSGASAGGEAAPAKATAKIDATCQEPAPEVREALETAAVETFERLRAGQLDALWSSIHPQARQEGQREAFTSALASMQRRLGSGADAPSVTSVHFVDISGGASALARVRCEGDEGEGLTLITNAGDEDVAVVVLRSAGTPFSYATTVQLRRHGKTWKVLGVHVGLDTYRGRDAADYERLADAYVKQQRTVEAYLVLTLAEQLANRGGSLKLDRALSVADKLRAVADSREYQQQLGVWDVGGRDYDIEGFSVTATQSDLSAVVRYVTPTGLIQEALDQEADALLAHLQMQHPEIGKRFDAVVFEAYDSTAAAAKPGSEVQAFRTPRVFPEQVAEPVPGKTSRPG
ncbi:MAG: hypothetical protein ACE37F_10910 [Nannocystaceae bacterium]|nr:hypothetical protein [bacterium]